MAKIDRFNGDYKAFGSNATGTERTVFGEVTQDDSLTANITTDFLRGWGVVDENGFPPRNWFNAIAYTVSQTLAYLHQMGIAEWNTSQEYHLGSAVIDGSGKIYLSKVNSNTGNGLPANEDVNWKRILDITDLVSPAFTGTPTAPTASQGNNSTQLATTEYVDTASIGIGQTWQDFFASRSIGVTYTNSTGKPIMVSIGGNSANNSTSVLDFFVDGINISLLGNRTNTLGVYGAASFIVPDGSTYQVNATGGATLNRWAELR